MQNIFVEVFEGISREEQLEFAKEIGFTGFFSSTDYAHDLEELKKFRALGDALSLEYETVHCTIPGCSDIWFEGEAGDAYTQLMLREIDYCVEIGVPILIVHVQTDFRENTNFDLGVKRYIPVVQAAKEKGIRIALENADDVDYLYRMLEYFSEDHVGFCYDSGHEHSVTKGAHLLPDIGNRLICTHLHDNDGSRDQHMLPFDGTMDFERMAKDLKAIGYEGNLTFELRYSDAYAQKYTKKAFLEECYARALKFRDMINA